eukprot:CAMPEP_0172502236 /NCGR_PEP_ID=MMETSP1066-20121228/158069_1 /TAXON_ID=671091 /ORGANISM="Coscinodiscus wailesii, Strain CCMP2513" /LENGTH=99 /DNA_ID=CAMNT_0013277423 /DNA_START=72 /DNA_END=371 /DNA_ORIENTATION=+
MATALAEWSNKPIQVLTCDGRLIIGTLCGYDQLQNLVLKNSHERVFAPDAPVELVPLGLYVIRGDNVAVVGNLDEERDGMRDLREERAVPIKPVMQNYI